MTTDVAERQETQTTSEAELANASEGNGVTPESTAVGEEVQQNSDSESMQQQENTAPPDPREARLQALADAEREEAEQSGYQRAVAELTNQTPEKQRELQRQKTRQAHTNTLATIDRVYEAAKDEYGTPRALTPAELGQIKAAQNEYHKVALEAAEDSIADTVRDTAYAILPKPAQEAFTQLTSGEVDLPTYLNHWAETAALHTKAVKAMDLEAAVKASPKVKREVEAAKLKSFDEGREQGRLDPPGTSPNGGRNNGGTPPAAKSFIELEEKYGRGETNAAETAEYHRLKAQRSKSR